MQYSLLPVGTVHTENASDHTGGLCRAGASFFPPRGNMCSTVHVRTVKCLRGAGLPFQAAMGLDADVEMAHPTMKRQR